MGDDVDEGPITCAIPSRRRLDAALLIVIVAGGALYGTGEGLLRLLHGALAGVVADPRRTAWLTLFGTGAALFAAFVGILLIDMVHFRAAAIDARGVTVGMFHHPWATIAGFAVRSDGVMLRLRGRLWSRLVGPIIVCDGELLHRVVVRLERHGVARLDG